MKINRLSARQIKEAKIKTEKRTSRRLLKWFILVLVLGVLFEYFYSNGSEIRYKFRQKELYGKVIPVDLICMTGNYFMEHKTIKFVCQAKVFYMCSEYCEIALINDFKKFAFTKDTISGDWINKSDAIPGLRQKNKPEIIYFANMKNFQNYYNKNKKNSK